MPSGKRGKAKENYLVQPGSDSDCSYQLRETDFSGISPAPGTSWFALDWFALDDSFLWKVGLSRLLGFLHSLPHATTGATWLPPQGRGSLETLLASLAAGGWGKLPLRNRFTVPFLRSASSL